jgi:D-alanyl-D-alanine endopeptidase (penicillin-binding protein 7)
MPIASITKLMTALVVSESGQPLDEELVVSADDVSVGKGSISRLLPGTRLTRGDLMHLALMSSENRAAHALGRNYPGGLSECVRAMNAKARELGMTSTHFVEPTGLSDENVASPEDLSKLVMAAAKVPLIHEYSTDSRYEVRVGRRTMRYVNTDSLVSAGLEHRGTEDRLHLRGGPLHGDDDHRGPHGGHRAAELWQAHARGRCEPRAQVGGIDPLTHA